MRHEQPPLPTCAFSYSSNTIGELCIEVCPWSEPGRGTTLSAALLSKRPTAAAP